MVKNKYNYTPVQKEPKNFSPLVAYIFIFLGTIGLKSPRTERDVSNNFDTLSKKESATENKLTKI